MVIGKSMTDRLTMMVFRKSKLFDAAISDGRRKSSLTDQQLDNLNSYVISASIAGKKIQDLKDSVKTIFKPLKVMYSTGVPLASFICTSVKTVEKKCGKRVSFSDMLQRSA